MQKCNGRDLHGVLLILIAVTPSMLIVLCESMMSRPPRQQVQRMRQHQQNRRERTSRARRTPRQIHNQRISQRPANRTAQRCQRRLQQPIGSHTLRQSIDQPLTDHPRSLRRHIPLRQPGPSRRHNQVYNFRVTSQRLSDLVDLIRQHLAQHLPHPGIFQQLAHSRPR
jgi:hypothetical protein